MATCCCGDVGARAAGDFCHIRGSGSEDEHTNDAPSRIIIVSLYISSTPSCDVSLTCCVRLFAMSGATDGEPRMHVFVRTGRAVRVLHSRCREAPRLLPSRHSDVFIR